MAISIQTKLADRIIQAAKGKPAAGGGKAVQGLTGAHLRFVIEILQAQEIEEQRAAHMRSHPLVVTGIEEAGGGS